MKKLAGDQLDARKLLLTVVLFLTAVWLARFVHRLVPIDRWLLWYYAGFALGTVLWMLSCLSIGHLAIGLLPALHIPFRERLVFDFALGVLLFAEGLFVAGLCGLLRPPFFYVYPLTLFAIGAGPLVADSTCAREAALLIPARSASVMYKAALMFGMSGLIVVYLTIMMPENMSFDARTYHLPIAEHYAAWGRIGKFPEGWFPGTLPHLASWLFTWPFTQRNQNLFCHVELAAHMEFALFAVTVFSTPLLVGAICPRYSARGTWAVFFLFPGLFLYDSSLSLAADHMLAFWAVPLALGLRRMLQRPSSPARAALVGLMMVGAVLTKYQAVYLVVPAALVILFSAIREVWRRRAEAITARPSLSSIFAAPGALALAAVVASASHWLANLVWHGNPVYPMLGKVFPSRPLVANWLGPRTDSGWEPTGDTLAKLRETAAAMCTFAFVPHDWPTFHRDLPVFGFLFTLTLPVLLLVPGQWRARALAGGTLLGVFIWYWTYHQDRYLQALLPWMVATTAAALLLAWGAGAAARIAVSLLVAVQLAWGGDVAWLPTHAMTGDVPALQALKLFSSTFRGDFTSRWQYDSGFGELERTLPKNANVLLHEEYLRLGLNRRAIADSARWQGAIDYRQLVSPDRVHDMLVSLGATHIVWGRSVSCSREIAVSGELVFFGYVLRYGEERQEVGGFGLAKLPASRPPPREPGLVAYLGCQGAFSVRLDEVDGLVGRGGNGADPGADPSAMVAAAEFAVVDGRCEQNAPAELAAGFIQAPAWGDLALWVRRN